MSILVTGGAGYIGSFMTKRLLDEGYIVTVVDSLERGHRTSIDKRAEFEEGNLLNKDFVRSLFAKKKYDAIIHFAGYISMAESMENPCMYFENNTLVPTYLLEEIRRMGDMSFLFSSTAGVYGNPIKVPIPEDHPKSPTNPYGLSKKMVEEILSWYHKLHGITVGSLRYFNAAGAALDGTLGEDHDPETHIIPNAIHAILRDEEFLLYGKDYNTKDGTAIRDYIHVYDLVEAHVLALQRMEQKKSEYVYNVGTGIGYSNAEVIEMVENVSQKKVKVKVVGRRPGDAEVLIADASSIQKELGFSPRYSDLKTIVETAWKWHRNHSQQ